MLWVLLACDGQYPPQLHPLVNIWLLLAQKKKKMVTTTLPEQIQNGGHQPLGDMEVGFQGSSNLHQNPTICSMSVCQVLSRSHHQTILTAGQTNQRMDTNFHIKKKKKQHDVSKFQQTIQKTKYGPSSSITSHYCAEIRHFSGCDKRSSIIISQFAAYGVGFSCSAMCADSLSARTRKNKSSTSAINSAFTQQQLAVAM